MREYASAVVPRELFGLILRFHLIYRCGCGKITDRTRKEDDMLKTDGLLKSALIWLSIFSVIEYALYHIEYIFSGNPVGDFLGLVRHYLTEGWEFMIPPIVGMLMLIILAYRSVGRAFLFGGLVSLSRMFYYLPWYYMYYIYNMGFDSLEAIFFSFLTAIGFSLLSYIEGTIFFGAAVAVLYIARRRERDALPYLKGAMPHHDTMNVTEGTGMPLGTMSLLAFVRRTVIVTVDTVKFFISHGSSYRIGEVISIVVDYLYALLLLVIVHIVISGVKKRILDARLMKANEQSSAEQVQ